MAKKAKVAGTRATFSLLDESVSEKVAGNIEKPFPDPDNKFRWFITHAEKDSQTAKPTGEHVTSYFLYEVDFERGKEKYASSLITFGEYKD